LGPVFEDGGGGEGEEGGDAEGEEVLRTGGETRDEVGRWVRLVSAVEKRVSEELWKRSESSALVIGQRDPNLVEPRRVEHS